MCANHERKRPPAQELGAAVADLTFETIPSDVVRTVERCFVDTVGVALLGSTTGAGLIAREVIGNRPGDVGETTVFGSDRKGPITDATFANGTAAHCLDYDDVTDAYTGHPSACLVPGILAIAERESVTGEAIVEAYVAGFETAAALAAPLTPDHYKRGWHSTSTFGTFGVAAAAASLLELDAKEVAVSLNVAASMPSGLKRNFGSMVKPMHAGQAARSGVTAALLAAEGFEAVDDAIGGRGGFFDLYGDGGAANADIRPPGSGDAITEYGIDLKKYPCCYFTHSAIEATSTLVQRHVLTPETVDSVTVSASRGAVDALPYESPVNGFEGRFSMTHTVASAIVDGDVGPRSFEGERIDDPTIRSLRDRITLEEIQSLPYASYETTVHIKPTDGETVSHTIESPPGYHDNPLSDEELCAKFEGCVSDVLHESAASELYRLLDSLATAENATEITEVLRAGE